MTVAKGVVAGVAGVTGRLDSRFRGPNPQQERSKRSHLTQKRNVSEETRSAQVEPSDGVLRAPGMPLTPQCWWTHCLVPQFCIVTFHVQSHCESPGDALMSHPTGLQPILRCLPVSCSRNARAGLQGCAASRFRIAPLLRVYLRRLPLHKCKRIRCLR